MSKLIDLFLKQNSKLKETPSFPLSIYNQLPSPLKECCEKFQRAREKDVFLTSALTIVSGCLPNLKGMHSQHYYYANFYSLIVAPPASGKGVMKFAKELGAYTHAKLMKDGTLSSVDSSGENAKRMLFIPANTSAAMFLIHLKCNDSGGIICESEADTLVNSLKQEWGNFSDSLRAAFHHETISYSRKTTNEHFEIENPKLSVLITGTPNQIKALIPSAENGLFSRNLFYLFTSDNIWKSPKPCFSCNSEMSFFKEQGKIILELGQYHLANELEFRFSDEHWDKCNSFFAEMHTSLPEKCGHEASPIVSRMSIIHFRISMVLSALRNFLKPEEDRAKQILICNDEDFECALSIVKVCLEHSMLMLELTPQSMANAFANLREKFFQDLPTIFSRSEGIATGAKIGIKTRTADRHLSDFVKHRKLTNSSGKYQKI